MQKFIVRITQPQSDLLDNEALECFILGSDLPKPFAAEFAMQAKSKRKLVLAETPELCTALNLDGAILDLSKSANVSTDYKKAAESLKKKIIGVICRGRRHEAMLASECEPDFLIFRAWTEGQEKIRELTDWYAEMFLIQSALLPMDDDLEFCAFASDFVILDDIKYKIFLAKK